MEEKKNEEICNRILETLLSFNIEAEIYRVEVGPSVTRYDVDIPRNIPLRAVIARSQDIAMCLGLSDGIHINGNNENGTVSIEVPNAERTSVALFDVLKSDAYQDASLSSLVFGLGESFHGEMVCKDLTRMPHILAGGVSGSGKTVFLNSLIASLIIAHSPDEIRLMLLGCDFKDRKNEFRFYEGLPHLMTGEIICNQACFRALDWLNDEMERRYKLFDIKSRLGFRVRSIDEFNENLFPCEKKMPKIVVVIDDMTILLGMDKDGWEKRLVRLCQKARGAGIHLAASALITDEKLDPEIMDCFPTLISFRLGSTYASRMFLGESGAEFLVRSGDLLLKLREIPKFQRIQGAYITKNELLAVVERIKESYSAQYDKDAANFIHEDKPLSGKDKLDNSILLNVLRTVVMEQTVSPSLLQRKCHLSYEEAQTAMEWLEAVGYVATYDLKSGERAVRLKPSDIAPKEGL